MAPVFQRIQNNRVTIFAGILIVLACGLPWWLIDYKAYSLNSVYTYVSIGSCLLGAFLLTLFTRLSFKEVLVIALVSHLIAFGIKVLLDTIEDTTNHNLLPFEMGFYLIIDLAGCSALIGAGLLIRKLFIKKAV